MCGRMVAFLIEQPGGGVVAGPPCVGVSMRDYRCVFCLNPMENVDTFTLADNCRSWVQSTSSYQPSMYYGFNVHPVFPSPPAHALPNYEDNMQMHITVPSTQRCSDITGILKWPSPMSV